MAVLAVIGVLAFLISLLARVPMRRQAASGAGESSHTPNWYEFMLALILLAAIAAFAIWLISTGKQWPWGETIIDWRSDTRAIVFAAIMVGLGVVGIAVSLAYTLAFSPQRSPPPAVARAAETVPTGAEQVGPGSSPWRILGLLVLALALVLLCWIALSHAEQHGLILQLVYPAAMGVALVLLLDKTARSWGSKNGVEAFREWLFCDLLIFLLVLAFLNLRSVAKPDAYSSSFWDILNVVLFFAAFWTIDRSSARGRFLLGYGYLVILPLLLLIWDLSQGVAAANSWWASIWPFVILAAAFFVLEAIALVASAAQRQILPLFKDALFVVLYAVLLIVAAKSHA
jgi:hypothetical protein